MKIIAKIIYYLHLKYVDTIKKVYYKNLLFTCGDNLRIYGSVNIKNPLHISLGKNCTINDNVYLNGWSSIEIGNNVALSADCMIISTGLDIESFIRDGHGHKGKGIKIGNNVQVGAGAIILDGVHIGNNVIIGAGSVVSKNISSNVIIAGVPAKVLRNLNNE